MEEVSQTRVREEASADGNEVVRTKQVKSTETVSNEVLAARVISFIGGALLLLLIARFLLLLFGASRVSGFVDFIYTLSSPFAAPFNGIFSEPAYGTARFDTSTLVAVVVYAVIFWGLAKLVTIASRREA